ncbi:hypothetical protein MIR68_010973 [Amoeboaphelidium protococcarum]|nr:hypothetical protein MIR68_010973 [Amoeboaphelidium protococcarum]
MSGNKTPRRQSLAPPKSCLKENEENTMHSLPADESKANRRVSFYEVAKVRKVSYHTRRSSASMAALKQFQSSSQDDSSGGSSQELRDESDDTGGSGDGNKRFSIPDLCSGKRDSNVYQLYLSPPEKKNVLTEQQDDNLSVAGAAAGIVHSDDSYVVSEVNSSFEVALRDSGGETTNLTAKFSNPTSDMDLTGVVGTVDQSMELSMEVEEAEQSHLVEKDSIDSLTGSDIESIHASFARISTPADDFKAHATRRESVYSMDMTTCATERGSELDEVDSDCSNSYKSRLRSSSPFKTKNSTNVGSDLMEVTENIGDFADTITSAAGINIQLMKDAEMEMDCTEILPPIQGLNSGFDCATPSVIDSKQSRRSSEVNLSVSQSPIRSSPRLKKKSEQTQLNNQLSSSPVQTRLSVGGQAIQSDQVQSRTSKENFKPSATKRKAQSASSSPKLHPDSRQKISVSQPHNENQYSKNDFPEQVDSSEEFPDPSSNLQRGHGSAKVSPKKVSQPSTPPRKHGSSSSSGKTEISDKNNISPYHRVAMINSMKKKSSSSASKLVMQVPAGDDLQENEEDFTSAQDEYQQPVFVAASQENPYSQDSLLPSQGFQYTQESYQPQSQSAPLNEVDDLSPVKRFAKVNDTLTIKQMVNAQLNANNNQAAQTEELVMDESFREDYPLSESSISVSDVDAQLNQETAIVRFGDLLPDIVNQKADQVLSHDYDDLNVEVVEQWIDYFDEQSEQNQFVIESAQQMIESQLKDTLDLLASDQKQSVEQYKNLMQQCWLKAQDCAQLDLLQMKIVDLSSIAAQEVNDGSEIIKSLLMQLCKIKDTLLAENESAAANSHQLDAQLREAQKVKSVFTPAVESRILELEKAKSVNFDIVGKLEQHLLLKSSELDACRDHCIKLQVDVEQLTSELESLDKNSLTVWDDSLLQQNRSKYQMLRLLSHLDITNVHSQGFELLYKNLLLIQFSADNRAWSFKLLSTGSVLKEKWDWVCQYLQKYSSNLFGKSLNHVMQVLAEIELQIWRVERDCPLVKYELPCDLNGSSFRIRLLNPIDVKKPVRNVEFKLL